MTKKEFISAIQEESKELDSDSLEKIVRSVREERIKRLDNKSFQVARMIREEIDVYMQSERLRTLEFLIEKASALTKGNSVKLNPNGEVDWLPF